MSSNSLRIAPLGINYDLPPSQLGNDEYSSGRNVSFRNRAAFRVEGYKSLAQPLNNTVDFLLSNRRPGNLFYFLYPGEAALNDFRISVTDLDQHWDITPTIPPTDSTVGFWTGTELNGLAMLNNAVDTPWYWTGNTGDIMEPIPNWPANTIAGWIRSFKYFLLAGNIQDNGVVYENQFYWSGIVEPGQPPSVWTPAPDNSAGDNILAGTPGSIIDGMAMRDHFVLAKNHSLYLLNFSAGQFVFTIHKLSATTGCLSTNCMTEYKGFLYILTDGDVVRTDGQRIESIASQRVKRTLFEDLNQAAYQTCFVTQYVKEDEIWFCFPSGDSVIPDRAAIYDVVQGVWGLRILPPTNMIAEGIINDSDFSIDWEGDSQSWFLDPGSWNENGLSSIADGLLIGTDDDRLLGVALEVTFDGDLTSNYVEKTSMDFGELVRFKLVTQIWPYITGTLGAVVLIRVGSQMHETDAIAWGQDQEYIIGETDKVDVFAQGRLISIRITGPDDTVWSIKSIEFRYDIQGLF